MARRRRQTRLRQPRKDPRHMIAETGAFALILALVLSLV